jgi:ribosomal protein S18 acetylase RimI-like enzyme
VSVLSPPPLVIRNARVDELEAVGDLTTSVYRDEKLTGGPYAERLRDAAARALAPRTEVVAAVRGDEVVGALTLAFPGSPWAQRAAAGEAEFRALVVAASVRGSGVGTALVRDAISRSRARGCRRLVLSTMDGVMADAQRLYGQLGFQRAPELDWSPPDSDTTLVVYALRLDDIRVRPAAAGELDAVGELTVAAYRADAMLDNDADYADELADGATRAAHGLVLVAVDDSEVVLGAVSYCRAGSPLAEIARPGESEFRMLAVSPKARGRGVGETLVHACTARARADGGSDLVLCTLTSTDVAQRLYRRLGFVRLPERDFQASDAIELIAYGLRL